MIGTFLSYMSTPIVGWYGILVGSIILAYFLWSHFHEWKEKNDLIDARFRDFVKEIWYDRPIVSFIPEESEQTQPVKNLNPVPKTKPKTLHDFFNTDFKTGGFVGTHNILATNQATKSQANILVEMQLLTDFFAKSEFLSFYIPQTVETYLVCEYLAEKYVTAFSLKNSVHVEAGMEGERKTAAKDLQFTGRIFIYHEYSLTTEQKESLVELYKKKDLSLILRGSEYSFDRNHPRVPS